MVFMRAAVPSTSLTSVAYVVVLPGLEERHVAARRGGVGRGRICGVPVVGAVQVFPPSVLVYESNARIKVEA